MAIRGHWSGCLGLNAENGVGLSGVDLAESLDLHVAVLGLPLIGVSFGPWLKSANSTIIDNLDGHPGYTGFARRSSTTTSDTTPHH